MARGSLGRTASAGALQRALGEPLVHFVALGALLFALHQRWGAGEGPQGGIHVDAGEVQSLATGFAASRGRPPAEEELRALVEEHVREEVLYRQALALGLERGDTLVRRRLVQKLEFLMEDLADAVAPSQEELADHLLAHGELYRPRPALAFRDVFVRSEWRGTNAEPMAQGLLAHLRAAGAEPGDAELGDARLVEPPGEPMPLEWIAERFGAPFAERLAELAPERWEGPIASEGGLHLVRVTARVERPLPELEQVRERVEHDWRVERRRRSAERLYAELRARQDVRVDWPDGGAEQR